MTSLTSAFRGNRLVARVLRSSSWLVLGYGGSQALRLASNLILARLLFPEAFGLMALVNVVTMGLMMFSDVGIGPAISQNKRGDDPAFLNTAWTIQVIRGFCLWAGACLLAWPMSQLYDAPELATYLPIAAVSLILAGFNPTRIETAHRHLLVGRVTVLGLTGQFIGILSMIVLAWITQSVIALVIGGVIGAAAKLLLTHLFLPGEANRFQWERAAAKELIRFGKWIFLSTAFWFVTSQGDKAILGKFLSLETLGIYNIGYFLASFPLLLGHAVTQKVLIPIYREMLPAEGSENQEKLRKMRVAMTVGIMGLMAVMALVGPWLVDVLYDDRYVQAGGMVVLIACALVPQVIGATYDHAALAAGDSKRFFVFSGTRAVIQVAALLIGITQFGLLGALVALGLSAILVYPVLVWLARVHGVWDAAHDAMAALAAAVIVAGAIGLHLDPILQLAAL
ncbi:oligosaccharide flippase family protein [Roseovarius sp. MMSF_3281]|uniref:oligosaccharide flippase family protein n=1 Tax=Roseovarius sp. MMSF_3281 TaxID=3046694 RepID=UPI00273F59F8|nr:oligosaccharide flippase family protein [Roseovarius sp. MMSF_3281]